MTLPKASGRCQAAVNDALPPLLNPQSARSCGRSLIGDDVTDAGEHLVDEEVGVRRVGGVVLRVAVAGVDEDTDHGRDRTVGDEVVEHDRGPHLVVGVEEAGAVLEDHDRQRLGRRTRRRVHPDAAAGAGIGLRVGELQPRRAPARDAGRAVESGPCSYADLRLVDRQRRERHAVSHADEPSDPRMGDCPRERRGGLHLAVVLALLAGRRGVDPGDVRHPLRAAGARRARPSTGPRPTSAGSTRRGGCPTWCSAWSSARSWTAGAGCR